MGRRITRRPVRVEDRTRFRTAASFSTEIGRERYDNKVIRRWLGRSGIEIHMLANPGVHRDS